MKEKGRSFGEGRVSFTAGKASGGLKGTETTREGGKMKVFQGKSEVMRTERDRMSILKGKPKKN